MLTSSICIPKQIDNVRCSTLTHLNTIHLPVLTGQETKKPESLCHRGLQHTDQKDHRSDAGPVFVLVVGVT